MPPKFTMQEVRYNHREPFSLNSGVLVEFEQPVFQVPFFRSSPMQRFIVFHRFAIFGGPFASHMTGRETAVLVCTPTEFPCPEGVAVQVWLTVQEAVEPYLAAPWRLEGEVEYWDTERSNYSHRREHYAYRDQPAESCLFESAV